jgi:hypothetical protein
MVNVSFRWTLSCSPGNWGRGVAALSTREVRLVGVRTAPQKGDFLKSLHTACRVEGVDPNSKRSPGPSENTLWRLSACSPGNWGRGVDALSTREVRLVGVRTAPQKGDFLKSLHTSCRVEGVDPDSKRSPGSSEKTLWRLSACSPGNWRRGVAALSTREVRLVGVRTPPQT